MTSDWKEIIDIFKDLSNRRDIHIYNIIYIFYIYIYIYIYIFIMYQISFQYVCHILS